MIITAPRIPCSLSVCWKSIFAACKSELTLVCRWFEIVCVLIQILTFIIYSNYIVELCRACYVSTTFLSSCIVLLLIFCILFIHIHLPSACECRSFWLPQPPTPTFASILLNSFFISQPFEKVNVIVCRRSLCMHTLLRMRRQKMLLDIPLIHKWQANDITTTTVAKRMARSWTIRKGWTKHRHFYFPHSARCLTSNIMDFIVVFCLVARFYLYSRRVFWAGRLLCIGYAPLFFVRRNFSFIRELN